MLEHRAKMRLYRFAEKHGLFHGSHSCIDYSKIRPIYPRWLGLGAADPRWPHSRLKNNLPPAWSFSRRRYVQSVSFFFEKIYWLSKKRRTKGNEGGKGKELKQKRTTISVLLRQSINFIIDWKLMLQIRIICYFHFDRFSINEFSKKKKRRKSVTWFFFKSWILRDT